ncbi:MAG: hypothetical protein ACRBBS_01285 [Thalassovita sp.]
MLMLIYAGSYVILNTFFGLIFLAWFINRDYEKHPEADYGGSNFWGAALAFSCCMLIVFVALGRGAEFNGYEIGPMTRLWMTAFGLPFALVPLLVFGPVWNRVNAKKRLRENTE